jgi:Skp family chaperone for outer membrane proteins
MIANSSPSVSASSNERAAVGCTAFSTAKGNIMKWNRLFVLLACCGLLIAGAANAASAQTTTKIAIAKPFVILPQMSEYKQLQAKFQAESAQLNAELDRRRNEIQGMLGQRAQFKPETPQFDDMSAKIDQKKTDLEAWTKMVSLSEEREQKKNLRELWSRIEAATDVVAKKNGFDLVLTDNRQALPNAENATYQGYMETFAMRNTLYAASTVDITDKIALQVEADYAAKARAAGAGIGVGGAVQPNVQVPPRPANH